MDKTASSKVTPRVGADVEPAPFMDLASGYIARAIERFPKQGSKRPWRLHQNYFLDLMALRFGRVTDESLEFKAKSSTSDA